MGSTENRKPVKRSSTQSHKLISRKGATAATPTKRTDVVRPKPSSKARQSKRKQAPRRKRASSRTVSGTHSPSSRTQVRSTRKPATKEERRADFLQRFTSSRVALLLVAIVAVIVVVGVFDTASNWGKAYGNVSVNGMNVSGMTAEQIAEKLKDEYGIRVSHAQVTIYPSEEAQKAGGQLISKEEQIETAEELSVEDANAQVQMWDVDALALKGTVPYEETARKAVEVGREDGGIAQRLGLLVGSRDVPMAVQFDSELVEGLASEIDLTVGDPRIDTTVAIVDGQAQVKEGHTGTLVDRSWLEGKLSDAMLSEDSPTSFVAEATNAQSRITTQQAEDMAHAINRAIGEGVRFNYEGQSWLANPAALGEWTKVEIVGDEGNWSLEPSIDASLAVPAIVSNVNAEITAEDMNVAFEVSDSEVLVHTSGDGKIPEVNTAVSTLQDLLYGDKGIAWGGGSAEAPTIEVEESDRPEVISFDDAVSMGVITVIGEYTTEFSNSEGTENRNHNIKLVTDIFDNGIIGADGGIWSFNDRSGDTNEEAGFWTAGSIVNGEYVDSVGGGICQVATTVFNAVLEAGLDVIERHNHTLYIDSYPTGRDAAVDYPSDLDLVWDNDLESDILMKTSYTDSSVTIKLYSVHTGYKTEFDLGSWQEGEKYVTLFEHDPSLGDGMYYRKTVGTDGQKIDLMRSVTDEKGDSVRNDSFQSNYSAKNEVYVIGDNVDTSNLVRNTGGGGLYA